MYPSKEGARERCDRSYVEEMKKAMAVEGGGEIVDM